MINIYHVYPVNDEQEHLLEGDFLEQTKQICCYCKCEPEIKLDLETDTVMIVHNSFDGREGVELANEVLNSSSDPSERQ